MAFGEYVATILVESMELLKHGADRAAVEGIVDTGYQVAHLVSGAFPPPFQIFPGPAGFPDKAA